MNALQNVAVMAARRGGSILLRHLNRLDKLRIEKKGHNDFVSDADRAAEDAVIEVIQKHYPDHAILAEEGTEHPEASADVQWVIDPLDGTTNFLHGLPHWSVSIALEHKGQVVAGVVYDPAKDEMFYAEKGEGAWMNESRLRVSARHRMIECIFATGLPFGGRSDLPETLRDLGRLLPATAGVRRFGSAALDLAYVAAGRYDGFWERRLHPWDMAAGLVIVREAGGFVEALDGGDDILGSGGVICANEPIFAAFAKTIRGA